MCKCDTCIHFPVDENCKSLLLTMFVWESTMFSACPNAQLWIDVQCSCVATCVCASFHILFQTLRLALVPVNTYQLCQTVCAIDQVLFVPPSYNQQLQLCAQCLPGHYFIKYCALRLKIFLEILKQRYILCPKVWDEEKWMVCEMLSARLCVRANLL